MKRTKDAKAKTNKRRAMTDDEMPTEVELLQELASLDEVSATIPTSTELDQGIYPSWCELVLELSREEGDFPLATRLPLRRHDGELISGVIHQVLHPQHGRSLFDMLWMELDKVIDRLMDGTSESKKQDRGMAQGLTLALAIMLNPYEYDVDAVRAGAMERRAGREALQRTA